MTLTVGSLFSGIGGIDLGLERAGMAVRWQSEINPYACRVLRQHWPAVPNIGDVRAVRWSRVERVDLICGGYPCQPFSLAGTRGGEEDERHLWPYFAAALRHLRPRYALVENVPGHLSLGFGRVLGDLADLGFDAEWDCIPAAALGAPHLRYRLFVIAYARGDAERDAGRSGPPQPQGWALQALARNDGEPGHVADTEVVAERPGLRAGRAGAVRWRRPRHGSGARAVAHAHMAGRPQQRRAGAGRAPAPLAQLDGRWPAEPDVGRVAYGVPNRVDRLACLGNAVVPAVAEWVGRRLLAAVGA